jgi:hypothetical protein
MNPDQIAAVAERVLRPRLGPLGLDRVAVAVGRDHDGDPAIFVHVHYGRGSAVPSGQMLSDAHGALHEALQAEGEERFPYLDHRFSNDEEFDEAEAEVDQAGDARP